MHEHLRGYGKLRKPLAALAQCCELLCLTCECCLDQQSQPGGKRREHNHSLGLCFTFSSKCACPQLTVSFMPRAYPQKMDLNRKKNHTTQLMFCKMFKHTHYTTNDDATYILSLSHCQSLGLEYLQTTSFNKAERNKKQSMCKIKENVVVSICSTQAAS